MKPVRGQRNDPPCVSNDGFALSGPDGRLTAMGPTSRQSDRPETPSNLRPDQRKARYYESHKLRPAVAAWYYRQIGPARRILDLGCGSGEFGRYRPSAAMEIHGIDVDQAAVAYAARHEIAVQGNLDETELPYEADFFDAVLARDILEHLQAPWLTLREVIRVLQPGGRVVASVVMAKPQAVWADYTHVRGFTRDSVALMFRDQGFDVDSVRPMGGIPLTSRLGLLDQVPYLLRLPLVGRRWATSWEIRAHRPVRPAS